MYLSSANKRRSSYVENYTPDPNPPAWDNTTWPSGISWKIVFAPPFFFYFIFLNLILFFIFLILAMFQHSPPLLLHVCMQTGVFGAAAGK